MKPKKRIQEMTFAALLTAIAILIPSIMPIKLIIPPASYTLGSHVPIFLAMFISPWVTAFVILASSLGYFMAGYPIVVVFRAFSHIIFGFLGALYLKKFPQTIENHRYFKAFCPHSVHICLIFSWFRDFCSCNWWA